MGDFAVGDRVRAQVVVEGEIVYANHDGTYEVAESDGGVTMDFLPASALTKLAKPLKVGDVLDATGGECRDLPVGTVLRGQVSRFVHLRTEGGWTVAGPGYPATYTDPNYGNYEVLVVPEVGA